MPVERERVAEGVERNHRIMEHVIAYRRIAAADHEKIARERPICD